MTLGDSSISTFNGNVTLCYIGFQVIKEPIDSNETLGCMLTFENPVAETFLLNSRLEDIPVSYVSGHYEFRYLPRLVGDVNADNRVDMRDIGDVCSRFGTTPSRPEWDSRVDLNADLRIDLRDIAIVCVNFGKTS